MVKDFSKSFKEYMKMFSRVMLALDLSELTPRMLDVLYSVCLDPETEIYLLHVVKNAENVSETSPYYKKSTAV